MKKMCTFYIVRHGQTAWNIQRRIQGQTDSALTKEGLEQIKLLAQKFRKIKLDLVFSSDLLRAKRTAEAVALEHDLAVQVTHLLRERNFGRLEGQPIDAIKTFEKYLKTLEMEARFRYKPEEEIESDEEVVSRMITFIRETAAIHLGKTVLVVSHAGMMRTFLIHLGFATYQDFHHGSIANTSYIKLLSDGVEFNIEKTEGITINK